MNRIELLILSIVIFLTIIAWIIADIYHTKTTSNLSGLSETVVIPKKKIDVKVIQALLKKTP